MEKQLSGNDRPLHLAKENDKTVLASPALRFRQIACDGDNDRRLSGKSGTEGVDVPHPQLRLGTGE